MDTARPVIGLLIGLMAIEAVLWNMGSDSTASPVQHTVLMAFLFGLPILLISAMLVMRRPWAVMATVMYATIALALDLATVVQEARQTDPRALVLALILLSSVLNFLVMVFGGRAAMDAGRTMPATQAMNRNESAAP